MKAPRKLGAYGMTVVLGLFGASGLMKQCEPAPTAAVSTDSCVTQVNKERAARGIAPVRVDSRVQTAAQKHSDYQASINKMTHTGRGYTNAGQRISAEGYRWTTWAENIAAGQRDCAQVMSAWMNSSGHRANILNPRMQHIGMGVAKSSSGTMFWTMDLAAGG
jgi:uncharacterized protein YkwD